MHNLMFVGLLMSTKNVPKNVKKGFSLPDILFFVSLSHLFDTCHTCLTNIAHNCFRLSNKCNY